MAWNKVLPWQSSWWLLEPQGGVGILHGEKRSALAWFLLFCCCFTSKKHLRLH